MMTSIIKIFLIPAAVAILCSSSFLAAQDTSSAPQAGKPPPADDSTASPGDSSAPGRAVVDSTATPGDSTGPALAADSAAQAGAAADSSAAGTPIPAGPVSQAPSDSTSLAEVPDSAARGGEAADSSGIAADSTGAAPGAASAVSTPETAVDETPEQPAARPKAVGGDEIDARVIPWDWDQYTHVIEIGLKEEKEEGRELSLEKNEEYEKLFLKYQGTIIHATGKIIRDSDGFYSMTVNSFEPLDSIPSSPSGGGGSGGGP